VEPAPPVQHPAPEEPDGRLGWHGSYAVSSHPANYFALLVFVLSPIMSVRWAAVGLVTLVYMFVGSAHEDRRLLAAYGDRYRQYRAQVPQCFVPIRRYVARFIPWFAAYRPLTSPRTSRN
jgi:protein-S-isoprenylcysteine O-methyltransferase Ste14